jgi:Ca-activated chloride channel homolog
MGGWRASKSRSVSGITAAGSQTLPAQPPDLFYGEELVLFGRYNGHGSGTILVTGERNGKREWIPVSASFSASEPANDFIPRLWAARQIGDLTRQIRLEGASSRLVEEVRQLGLRYGILTEYTSYLVQEPIGITRPSMPVPLQEDKWGEPGTRPLRPEPEPSSARGQVPSCPIPRPWLPQRRSPPTPWSLCQGEGGAAPETRRGGRTDVHPPGRVWTDVAQADRITVTDVAEYSRAYFDLVRQLPEVAPYLSVGEEILIAGRRVSVRIARSGIEIWQPGQLAALVRDFRGT